MVSQKRHHLLIQRSALERPHVVCCNPVWDMRSGGAIWLFLEFLLWWLVRTNSPCRNDEELWIPSWIWSFLNASMPHGLVSWGIMCWSDGIARSCVDLTSFAATIVQGLDFGLWGSLWIYLVWTLFWIGCTAHGGVLEILCDWHIHYSGHCHTLPCHTVA